MAYPSLPDRRMPYHRDGTVIGVNLQIPSIDPATVVAQGVTSYLTQADRIELNDGDFDATAANLLTNNAQGSAMWFFFPEQREVSAAFFGHQDLSGNFPTVGVKALYGSSDTTNGTDGTWETASFPSGIPNGPKAVDTWRSGIKPISFTGGKRTIRFMWSSSGGSIHTLTTVHLYGEKVAGQTPDDLIFIDHDTTPGVEYTAPEDFGDRPLGTSVVRQFRVKNASATKTANSINLQCNDADFAISTDNSTWVVTINLSSLVPGAESATMYIRNTTPAPGAPLGPRFAEIVAIVGSWT